MTARDDILKALRKSTFAANDLPPHEGPWIEYDDPRKQFLDALEAVGGSGVLVANAEEAAGHLEQLPPYRDAKEICSVVPEIAQGNVDLEQIDDPHQLESIDFALLRGDFAVAENGAVWTTDEGVKHRVLYFLAQHIGLIVDASEIVHNMHQAYERLSFPGRGFGVFISGPSKTADIEQSLVIGAHGARSLSVIFIESR